MKKLYGYLIEYQRKYFDLKLYLLTALYISCWIAFNYLIDFEDRYLDHLSGCWYYWPAMVVWMLIPFLGVVFILWRMGKISNVFIDKQFWIMVLLGFAILAADRTFSWYEVMKGTLARIDYIFFARCMSRAQSLFIAVVPLLLLYRFSSPKPPGCYGLLPQKAGIKPYFSLLAVAILIIGIGSFFSDIQAYYPRYEHTRGDRFAASHGLPEVLSVLIYEICYGSDFVAVELFFRGFLIHAFVRWLGAYAVLPMVATYAFLHFGKPLTETVSSVFGGYLLGVFSYRTESIWGGIMIHIGVAWSMEVFGYLQGLT